MHAIIRNKLLLVTYIMTLLYALHYGIPLYASSSFLHQYFTPKMISLIYAVSALVAIITSVHFTKYLKRYHTYRFTVFLVITQIISTISVAFSDNNFLVAFFFIAHFFLSALIFTVLNVFIENLSPHGETGMVRGLFLTLLNLGIVVSPFIGASIIAREGYAALYVVAGIMLIPFLFFLRKYMNHMEEPTYHNIDLWSAFRDAWKNENLRNALVVVLLLQCFYVIMIIYSPIYVTSIGISLTTYLSAILPLALTPFILMPYELGIIADTKLGEKELMILGLVIMAIATLSIAVIETTNVLVWLAVFLFSRIGAACVETMTFSYYFKKISAKDSSLIVLFSNMSNLATMIVAVIGIAIAPMLVTYSGIMFIIMGVALLLGVLFVIPIQDTK